MPAGTNRDLRIAGLSGKLHNAHETGESIDNKVMLW